jgi:hypothetical protein
MDGYVGISISDGINNCPILLIQLQLQAFVALGTDTSSSENKRYF